MFSPDILDRIAVQNGEDVIFEHLPTRTISEEGSSFIVGPLVDIDNGNFYDVYANEETGEVYKVIK